MTQTPEELKDIIKGTSDGLLSFVESECVPVEQQYREILRTRQGCSATMAGWFLRYERPGTR